MGLMEAGFAITASWPINTEAEGSLHIKDKSAANSTIFLVCRPRAAAVSDETTYWEDIEPLLARAVRARVAEFQQAGITGVDLYSRASAPPCRNFPPIGRCGAARRGRCQRLASAVAKRKYSRKNSTPTR